MEDNFIRPILKAARAVGFSQEERETLVRGGDDAINDTIKGSHPRKFGERRPVEGTEQFLQFTEGTLDTERPFQIFDRIVTVLRRYGSRTEKDKRLVLSREEGKILSVAVKYFEDWFYRGVFLRAPEKFQGEKRAGTFFGGSAFVLNQIAKVKEVSSQESIASFDMERIQALIKDVSLFAEEYMSEENLGKMVENEATKLHQLDDEFMPLDKKRAAYDTEIDTIKRASTHEYWEWKEQLGEISKEKGRDGGKGESERDREACKRFFEKVILPIENELERGTSPSVADELWRKGDEERLIDILRKKLSELLRNTSPQEHLKGVQGKRFRLPSLDEFDHYGGGLENILIRREAQMQEKYGSSDTLRMLFDKRIFADKRKRADEKMAERDRAVGQDFSLLQSKNDDQRKILLEAQRVFRARATILRTLATSVALIETTLQNSKAGDVYFLKTILIVAAEQAEKDRREKSHHFFPDISIVQATRDDAIFDFERAERTIQRASSHRGESFGNYMQVHFSPSQIPVAQFVVEYMRRAQKEGK